MKKILLIILVALCACKEDKVIPQANWVFSLPESYIPRPSPNRTPQIRGNFILQYTNPPRILGGEFYFDNNKYNVAPSELVINSPNYFNFQLSPSEDDEDRASFSFNGELFDDKIVVTVSSYRYITDVPPAGTMVNFTGNGFIAVRK